MDATTSPRLASPREASSSSRHDQPRREAPAVWLSGKEAAEHVGVSWPTLRQTIIEHSIPHVRMGRRWKIEAGILDDHLRQMAATQVGR